MVITNWVGSRRTKKKYFDGFIILLGILTLFLSQVVKASIFSDLYIGGGYSRTSYGNSPTYIGETTSVVVDGRAVGSIIYAGTRVFKTKIVGVELDYHQFGTRTGIITSGNPASVSDYWMSLSAVNLSLGVYPSFLVDDKLTLFVRVGVGYVKIKDSEPHSTLFKRTGELGTGVGWQYRMNNNMFVRMNYSNYYVSVAYTEDASSDPRCSGNCGVRGKSGPDLILSSLNISLGYKF